MDDVTIRPFRNEDAPLLAALFHASVRQIGVLDYSVEQVRAWSRDVLDDARYLQQATDGRIFLVAVDGDDRPLAYGDLERDGHIDHIYCHPDAVGKGIASRLYDQLELCARKVGIGSLHVEASEAARRLFERKGFAVGQRNDFEIEGVKIHNYRMTKALGATW